MKKKRQSDNKKNFLIHLANAFIAAVLVLAGAFTSGEVTDTAFIAALSAAVIVFATKMREFLNGLESEIKVLNFV